MVTTSPRRIGRTRKKLARMIQQAVPGSEVFPEDLDSQIPVYASAYFDGCSWSGMILVEGIRRTITSWDTMTKCVRNDFTLSVGGVNAYADYECHARTCRPGVQPKQKGEDNA